MARAGSRYPGQIGEWALQDVLVEKDERIERLILRRGSHPASDGEVRQKGDDLALGHILGVTISD